MKLKSITLTNRNLFLFLFAALLAAHLCHSRILWAEEGLPIAGAQQVLFGKVLYRDIWFDKPPLVPLIYVLWGARIGVALRIAGAAYCGLVCWLSFAVARALWTDREARWAAGLMAFFLTFDTPSSVLPLAADSLLLAPHLLAVLLAIRKRAIWSGIAAGIGFLFNTKAVFVLASCAVFAGWSAPLVCCGFLLPCGLAGAVLAESGAWRAFVDQVWVWPSAYARNTFVDRPALNGLIRTANWAGFHAALLIPMGRAFTSPMEKRKIQLAAWGLLSLAAVALGWRFFPRYYFQLLPFAVVVASRGFTLLNRARAQAIPWVPGRRWWWLTALLLVAPLVRFGPRYVLLAANLDRQWSDVAMDRASRDAAAAVLHLSHTGDSLYVWGYRPDLFAYTHMLAASRYLDCQAMTGVPADRHLTQSTSVLSPEATAAARRELAVSHPDFVLDGLSLYNPRLAMTNYPELQPWIAQYREVARVGGIIIYARSSPGL